MGNPFEFEDRKRDMRANTIRVSLSKSQLFKILENQDSKCKICSTDLHNEEFVHLKAEPGSSCRVLIMIKDIYHHTTKRMDPSSRKLLLVLTAEDNRTINISNDVGAICAKCGQRNKRNSNFHQYQRHQEYLERLEKIKQGDKKIKQLEMEIKRLEWIQSQRSGKIFVQLPTHEEDLEFVKYCPLCRKELKAKHYRDWLEGWLTKRHKELEKHFSEKYGDDLELPSPKHLPANDFITCSECKSVFMIRRDVFFNPPLYGESNGVYTIFFCPHCGAEGECQPNKFIKCGKCNEAWGVWIKTDKNAS